VSAHKLIEQKEETIQDLQGKLEALELELKRLKDTQIYMKDGDFETDRGKRIIQSLIRSFGHFQNGRSAIELQSANELLRYYQMESASLNEKLKVKNSADQEDNGDEKEIKNETIDKDAEVDDADNRSFEYTPSFSLSSIRLNRSQTPSLFGHRGSVSSNELDNLGSEK